MSESRAAPALRLATPEPSLGQSLAGLWDPECERAILGAAMLAEPMPAWLAPSHFFPTQHQRIYEAVQSVGGNPSRVNAWLRESSSKFGPQVAKSRELAEMCLEAEHCRRMGWSLDFERLRELAKRRALLEMLTRQTILLRGGEWSHAECYAGLKDYFRGAK